MGRSGSEEKENSVAGSRSDGETADPRKRVEELEEDWPLGPETRAVTSEGEEVG